MKYAPLILILCFSLFACNSASEPAAGDKKSEISAKVEKLMAQMTLEEKIGQMTLFTSDWDVTGPTIRENYREDIVAGRTGAIFNAHTAAYNHEFTPRIYFAPATFIQYFFHFVCTNQNGSELSGR